MKKSDLLVCNRVNKDEEISPIAKLAVSLKTTNMDIISKTAKTFVERYIYNGLSNYKKVIDAAKDQADDIDNQIDKIKFLNIILEGNIKEYDLHKPKCTNPEGCPTNFAHESIQYFLAQELSRLGVQLNEDTFTVDDRHSSDSKLDKILKDLEELKTGHEIIYDDLVKEINELKELYFLGKKKWYQIFAGKCLDMTVSGIVSETVSKDIIASIKPVFQNLING